MPRTIIVSPGDKYQNFTIIKEVESQGEGTNRKRHFMVRCELCGKEVPSVSLGNLRSGKTRNCLKCGYESAGLRHTIHGEAKRYRKTREYHKHRGMMRRCYDPKDRFYKDYGGRGILVCDRWHHFPNFLEDILRDIGRCPSPRHSIDRINNELGYRPGNITWSTPTVQNRNTRRNLWITYKGECRRLVDVCEEIGIPYGRAYYRYHRGHRDESVLFAPVRAHKQYEYKSKEKPQ